MTFLDKFRFHPVIFNWTQKSNRLFTLHIIRNFILTLLLLCGMIYLFNQNQSRFVAQEFYEYHNSLSYPITEENAMHLEGYLNDPYLPDQEKGICAETLYTYYFFSPDYMKAVQYVGHALYYYERCQDYYSIANSRFTMVLAMNSFHAFNNSERILQEILEIQIPEKSKADTIRYYAYVNLADIYSQTNHVDDALFYLDEAASLADTLSGLQIEYSYMELIIKARCLFYQKDFKGCEALLQMLPDNLLDNSTPFLNLYVSHLDVLSMALLENGKTKQALKVSQTLVDYCSSHNYGNVMLEHLHNMLELCTAKGIENAQLDNYRQIITDVSPSLIKQRSEDMAVFMKYAYDLLTHSMVNLIQVNELKGSSSFLIAFFLCAVAVFLIILKRNLNKSRLDGLTNTYNRRYFNYIYNGALINHIPFSIIVMDIDNFKSCNDVYGHGFGDEVLIHVCRCAESCLPEGTQLFRYGGEEFCVFAPYTTIDVAAKLAENIRQKVEALTWSVDTTITLSLGVAHSDSNDQPFTLADEHLYVSKRTGKNKVTWQ